MSDSVRPHRRQPTRLPCPWDSPGKNTGVGCHILLRCMKVKSESEVTQLCSTLRNPMDCSPPGSSVHGICQARVLEWGAIALSEVDCSLLQSFLCNCFPWKLHQMIKILLPLSLTNMQYYDLYFESWGKMTIHNLQEICVLFLCPYLKVQGSI